MAVFQVGGDGCKLSESAQARLASANPGECIYVQKCVYIICYDSLNLDIVYLVDNIFDIFFNVDNICCPILNIHLKLYYR